jgi:energy-coupling factor transport system ATP-binding protein
MLIGLELKPPEVAEVFWGLRGRGLELDRIPISLDEALSTAKALFRGGGLAALPRVEAGGGSESRETILEVRGVSYTYPTSPPVKALEDVDLSVCEGEFLAIVGKNGSGKTTLLKCIFGLLRPDEGEVLFRGRNILGFPARERVRKLSLVLQNPDHQLFSMSVEEEVRFGLKNIGLDVGEMDRRIDNVLSLIGLLEYRSVHPFQLSFGDRKKLAVASIVALDPEIIVLDEPTTGQDYKGRIEICDLARELNREGKTVLMVTHDMDLVARYARRMVVMNEGGVIFDGSVRDGFRRVDLLREAGLMPPRVTLFSQSLGDYGVPPDVLTVDELVDILSVGGG